MHPPERKVEAAAEAGRPVLAEVAGQDDVSLIPDMLDWIWLPWRGRRQRVAQLERRIAMLEQTNALRPWPHVQFEYDTRAHQARLHVTNHGAAGEFSALLTVDGDLAERLTAAVCARWEHTEQPSTRISRGEARTLRLAELDLSAFPFAQWKVYATGTGVPPVVRAMQTSVIGGDPTRQAAPILLEVAIVTIPDAVAGPVTSTIALSPFEATRLRTER